MNANRNPKCSTKPVCSDRENIQKCILSILRPLSIDGKTGKRLLQPMIADGLDRAGYVVDVEDTLGFLPAGLPVWRRRDTGEIEPTAGRRRIGPVALLCRP